MTAQTLRCPGCGAPATGEASACAHCAEPLATVGCPGCFGMMFSGTRRCSHCGRRARREDIAGSDLAGPRCQRPLPTARVGETTEILAFLKVDWP